MLNVVFFLIHIVVKAYHRFQDNICKQHAAEQWESLLRIYRRCVIEQIGPKALQRGSNLNS